MTPASPPLLLEGDWLSSEEFMTRWEALPDVEHAELLDGIVYVDGEVTLSHGRFHSILSFWLGVYAMGAPGRIAAMSSAWLMEPENVPQPDVTLRKRREGDGRYGSGAPELIVEIAVYSYSRDLGVKKRLYERMGVREYIVVVPDEDYLVWFQHTPEGFQKLTPGEDGIFRSRTFPGLWLDPQALWKEDLAGLQTAVQQGLAQEPPANLST
jgi:Uma2 family endonuclease